MNKLTAEKCREKFEAWWEENQHNGNPPRFGWDHYRDGEGYSDDEFQALWEVWQGSRTALEIALPVLEQQERGERHGSDFIECPWPCGWQELLRISMNDGAFLAKDLIEGGEVKDFHRHAALSNTDRLVRVISAIMKVQEQPTNQNGEQ